MDDIRRIVRIASRRLLIIDLIGSAAWALTIVTLALVALLIADRTMALGLPWMQLALGAVGAGALGALAWALATRAREAEVARILDEKAELRESLSTALAVERSTDAWSQAVVNSAVAKARRVVVPDALPIEGPRFWQVPLASLMAFTVLWFLMPQMDLLGKQAEQQAQIDEVREIQDAKTEATAALERTKAILAKSNIELGSLEADALELTSNELDEKATAAEVRNVAMRKLTSLTQELDEKLNNEQAQASRALETMLRQMRTPGQGPLTDLARDLARGDMRGAKAKLQELEKKLSDGSLTKEQQDTLAQQLGNVAEQLERAAQERTNLEQALRQAGMSAQQASQAASNPEQLQQALDQMQNLSEEQKQQLQQQAQAAQQAGQQAQNLGQAMQAMQQAMQQQAGQQAGEQGQMNQQMQQAMQQMAGQLSDMEMMQQDMQAMDQAMQQAMQQLSQLGQANGEQSWAQCNNPGQGMGQNGPWAAGQSNSQGGGSGGPGQGTGTGPEAQAADFMTESIKARVNNQGGPIIGSRLVFGDSIRGESVQEFQGAVARAAESATTEALEEQLVPREFHESVKAYFGRLERRAQQEAQSAPASDPE